MLMRPPAPPKPSMTNEKATASMIGLPQGSAAIQPNAPRPPRRRAGDLDRGADREHGQQRRQRHERGEGGMDELEAGADLRIREGVVDADRHRHDEEQDEGDPRPSCR